MKEKAKTRKQSEVWAANCCTFPTTKWQTRKGILMLGYRDGCDSKGSTWEQHPSSGRAVVFPSLCLSTHSDNDTVTVNKVPNSCSKSKLVSMHSPEEPSMSGSRTRAIKLGGRCHNCRQAANLLPSAVLKCETRSPNEGTPKGLSVAHLTQQPSFLPSLVSLSFAALMAMRIAQRAVRTLQGEFHSYQTTTSPEPG